jgi:hypothetical protein
MKICMFLWKIWMRWCFSGNIYSLLMFTGYSYYLFNQNQVKSKNSCECCNLEDLEKFSKIEDNEKQIISHMKLLWFFEDEHNYATDKNLMIKLEIRFFKRYKTILWSFVINWLNSNFPQIFKVNKWIINEWLIAESWCNLILNCLESSMINFDP